MADLGSFDRPILTDKYVDVLETIRENIKRSKAAADNAQQTANEALAAAGVVDAALGNYMPKSGGRFTGDIATQKIVSEGTIAIQGPGDGMGTLISSGPWGENRGAGLQLNGVSASDTGFGTSGQWVLYSPGNPTFGGSDRLLWDGNDLGRWAPIDPASKADATELSKFYHKTGGEISGRVMISGRDSVAANAMLNVAAPTGSPNNQRVFLAGWMGITNGFTVEGNGQDGSILYNFSDAPGGAYLYFKGNDLGRWAAIDPATKLNRFANIELGRPDGALVYAEGSADAILFRSGTADTNYAWGRFGNDGKFVGGGFVVNGVGDLAPWASRDPRRTEFTSYQTGDGRDWNDPASVNPGVGYYLMLGNNANGPSGQSEYFHPLTFCYSNPAGTENRTQLAISYGSPGSKMYIRGYYQGLGWTIWRRFITEENGYAYAGGFRATSDIRKKRDLVPIGSALTGLEALNGYDGIWIDTDKPGTFLIAQEVERVLPHAVSENDGVKSLDYNAVVALLVNAVKELNAKVEGALQHG